MRVVARAGPTSIVENQLGLVMAAAGVDASNVTPGHVVLLPEDPDASARALRQRVYDDLGRNVAVILTDTAGRAWRTGQTDLAVGAAGIEPLDDLAGMTDSYGNRLERHCAGRGRRAGLRLAELVTGKLGGRPISVVAGARRPGARPRRARPGGPGAGPAAEPRTCSPWVRARPCWPRCAVATRDCFGSPASTEEVRRGAGVLRPRGRRSTASRCRCACSVRRTSMLATRWPPPSGSAWSPTPTDGGRTAIPPRRTIGTPSRSHRPLRRLRSANDPIRRGGRVAKKNTRETSGAPSPSRCARNRRARSGGGACSSSGPASLVVLGLLGTAVFVYVKDLREDEQGQGHPARRARSNSTSAAECDPVKKAKANGNNNHIDPGTQIPYPEAPPAFGPHWGNYLQGSEIRNFYTVDDRPEVERMVHSLEHGHTILWYDDTVKPGTDAYKDVQAISKKFERGAEVHRRAVDGEGRQALPQRQARRPHPLDRSGEPAGHHAVLRAPQRRRRLEVHQGLPREQRTRARTRPEP